MGGGGGVWVHAAFCLLFVLHRDTGSETKMKIQVREIFRKDDQSTISTTVTPTTTGTVGLDGALPIDYLHPRPSTPLAHTLDDEEDDNGDNNADESASMMVNFLLVVFRF